jgi:hypothetical protein
LLLFGQVVRAQAPPSLIFRRWAAHLCIKFKNMKIQTVSITFACILSLTAGCTGSSRYPLVVADSDHRITLGKGPGPETPYEIDAASGIQLDISQIQFTIGGATVKPDTVYIFNGSKKLYHLAKAISGNAVVLDASTLNAINGPAFQAGPPFEGFQPGHRLMLHLGRENSGNPGYETMTAEWVALIMVK